MACKVLERDDVPHPPQRIFHGVVDEGDCRWRYEQGLLTHFIRYAAKTRAGELPWVEYWGADHAR
jgi:hypothetical protein